MDKERGCAREICPNGYESCEYPDCNIHESGHCNKHGIEVERRIHIAKDLNDFKIDVKGEIHAMMEMIQALSNKIAAHGRRLSYGAGVMLLSGLLITGAYVYNTLTTSKTDRQLEIVSRNVQDLLIAMSRNNERDLQQAANIDRVVATVDSMVEVQREHEKLSTRDHDEWYRLKPKINKLLNGE